MTGAQQGFFETYMADPQIVSVTAAKTLGVTEQCVRAVITTGAFTIKLPNVSEARGRWYSIRAAVSGGGAITLSDNATESEDWANKTLDADGDGIFLVSDGKRWIVLESDIA